MGRFIEMMESLGSNPAEAAARFPDLVRASSLMLMAPDSSESGITLAIGVAVWSAYDMRLLDDLDVWMSGSSGQSGIRIGVFDFGSHWADLGRYIPTLDIKQVWHTPVVGKWLDGVLIFAGSGADARNRVLTDLANLG